VKTFAVGHSDFYRRPDAVLSHGRVLFLEAVRVEAPGVLAALRDDVLPKFLAPSRSDDAPGIISAMRAWADRFNLRATDRPPESWVIEVGLRTLRTWAMSERVELRWSFPPTSARFPFTEAEERELQLQRAARERRHERRGEFALARARGFQRTPRKADATHYIWLARFQVLGETIEQVAKTPGAEADRTTVRSALRRTAASVGLVLRTPAPGRPRRVSLT